MVVPQDTAWLQGGLAARRSERIAFVYGTGEQLYATGDSTAPRLPTRVGLSDKGTADGSLRQHGVPLNTLLPSYVLHGYAPVPPPFSTMPQTFGRRTGYAASPVPPVSGPQGVVFTPPRGNSRRTTVAYSPGGSPQESHPAQAAHQGHSPLHPHQQQQYNLQPDQAPYLPIPDAVNTIDHLDFITAGGAVWEPSPYGPFHEPEVQPIPQPVVQPMPHMREAITPIHELPTMTGLQKQMEALHWRLQHALEVRRARFLAFLSLRMPACLLLQARVNFEGSRGTNQAGWLPLMPHRPMGAAPHTSPQPLSMPCLHYLPC